MARYRVGFEFKIGSADIRGLIVLPENRGIADIKDGFWVDDNLQWCVASEVRWFIMPHMVRSVHKIRDGEVV
jgi:hypothetical protein